MSIKNVSKKVYNYLKDRVTKKEITTLIGVLFIVAGPAGWATAEQIALIKSIMTAFGYFDPEVGAGTLSAVGAALVAYKEKK